jgi:hypothetical protein
VWNDHVVIDFGFVCAIFAVLGRRRIM